VTFETNDNYSIRFEMKKHYLHSTSQQLVPFSLVGLSKEWTMVENLDLCHFTFMDNLW